MCDRFFADILAWDGRTVLLLDNRTKTLTTVLLHDADGLAQLLGRKRKNVWVGIDDSTLRHVAWVAGGRGTELHYSRDTNKWYRRF